jgi:hypothetical protein
METMIKHLSSLLALGSMLALPLLEAPAAVASSHMDTPLLTFDPAANTTDVYAFKSSENGVQYLTVALGVYPFEEPGIGPNNYRFDPMVDYEIHVSLGNNVNTGRTDITYRFEFRTAVANNNTILQSYLGPVAPGTAYSPNENLRNVYKLTMTDFRTNTTAVLGDNLRVPPNNQGRLTPAYNQGDNGDNPAKGGVASSAALDGHTKGAIRKLPLGYVTFAGQRDDGFFADIQSIFDLDFGFAKPQPFDSQGGYNIHMIVLNIPISELGGAQIAGVYATTSRPDGAGMKQVARQGNPLFVEGLIAMKDKDVYSRTRPVSDNARFRTYAANPELSAALGVTPLVPGLLESIFIPDMIKVDMTTPPARLAGAAGFSRLSVFGGDVLPSTRTGGNVAGGWPNGRRFGDDVVDIAIIALGGAGTGPDFSMVDVDKVTANDITYNSVFPYAATPHNGRVHDHHN